MIRRPPRSTHHRLRRQRQMCIRDSNRDYANAKETNPIEVLSLLQKAVDSPSGEGRRFTEFASLLKDEILQSYLHEESIRGEIQREPFAPPRQMESKAISYCNRMWELWLEEESRHPPQRRKHIKQLFVQLSCALQKLSYPTSSIKPYLSLIHISEPTRPCGTSRMPSSA